MCLLGQVVEARPELAWLCLLPVARQFFKLRKGKKQRLVRKIVFVDVLIVDYCERAREEKVYLIQLTEK